MHPLPPGSTIGILGGGQLGRMLAMAAARLGLKCHIYSDHRGPAFDVAAATTLGEFDDFDRVTRFAETVDVVTYEFENVPLDTARAALNACPVRPGVKALEVAQDRLTEKRFVAGLGLPVAPFAPVDDDAGLANAAAVLGLPAILKTSRLGYDGKGQVRLRNGDDISTARAAIGFRPAILESVVAFEFEVSVLVVRAPGGETRFYDIPLNTHQNGILHSSAVPSPLPTRVRARALEMASHIATALDYVGVLGVEMFYVGNNAAEPLIVNEMAPRVHNSGHWTIDACLVSQFENHIRAVADWPLGPTERHSDAVMTNLIGDDVDTWSKLAAAADLGLHLYGKNDPRPGRKMGHVTRIGPKTS
ncbi:MAG: 5-(carboxyamino)imidazole ribonucleotide synthase [Hyphomicrobiaceae bacterium]|nr:5-(carboxyamino)imidazole ribonucleotide synthase [Hyphomicrobiaceae bacterium]